jgi:hypothetical protein
MQETGFCRRNVGELGQGRMARGGDGISKVSLGFGHILLFYTLQVATTVSRVADRRAGGLQSSSTPLDTPRRTPMN